MVALMRRKWSRSIHQIPTNCVRKPFFSIQSRVECETYLVKAFLRVQIWADEMELTSWIRSGATIDRSMKGFCWARTSNWSWIVVILYWALRSKQMTNICYDMWGFDRTTRYSSKYSNKNLSTNIIYSYTAPMDNIETYDLVLEIGLNSTRWRIYGNLLGPEEIISSHPQPSLQIFQIFLAKFLKSSSNITVRQRQLCLTWLNNHAT